MSWKLHISLHTPLLWVRWSRITQSRNLQERRVAQISTDLHVWPSGFSFLWKPIGPFTMCCMGSINKMVSQVWNGSCPVEVPWAINWNWAAEYNIELKPGLIWSFRIVQTRSTTVQANPEISEWLCNVLAAAGIHKNARWPPTECWETPGLPLGVRALSSACPSGTVPTAS